MIYLTKGLESEWPSQKPFTKHDSPEVLNEKRKNATKIQGTIIHSVDAVVPEPVVKMDDIDPKRFNSFEKLCCVTSCVKVYTKFKKGKLFGHMS